MAHQGFWHELKRRNVLRAAVLYAGTVWALVQGIAQLAPVVGLPEWVPRAFLVAAAIGFPFWLAFAWFYEFTPQGLKRESAIEPGDSIARATGRKLDKWIIAVLAIAVVLLLANTFVWHKGAGLANEAKSPTAPQKSIAVLPLANEGGDKDQQYFSDGLSVDLIAALSQFSGLKVISRNSSFQFRDSREDAASIGARLGVAHLLEGSVRRLGGTVRITAELVNVADGSTLWAQQYDRPYKDLFALQDEITTAVAGALKARLLEHGAVVKLGDRPPSGSLDAYNAYLQAEASQSQGTEDEYRRAIGLYDTAIRIDPRYAQAYAMRALVGTTLARKFLSGDAATAAYANALADADRAVALDPGLADGYMARGVVLQSSKFDWKGALREYQRAEQLAPNDAGIKGSLGELLATLGRPDEAVSRLRREVAIDPLCAHCYSALATYLASLGQLDEARRMMLEAIELQPRHADRYTFLAVIEILRGDKAAAMQAARQEVAGGGWQDIALALASQIGSDRAAADAAIEHLVATQPDDAGFQIAETYALRRDPDNTFRWLERAFGNHDPGLEGLLYDPFILRYRDDPRFAAICGKLGLPATTNAKAMP